MEEFYEKYDDYNYKVFLYGLAYQKSNERLYNFIATEYNKIEKPLRSLVILDWSNFLQYLIEKFSTIEKQELFSFWSQIFTGPFSSIKYNINKQILQKALLIFNEIVNDNNIILIGDGVYSDPKFYVEETAYRKAITYEDLGTEEMINVFRIYHEYEKEFKYECLAEEYNEGGEMSEFSMDVLIPENSVWVVAKTEIKHLILDEYKESLTRFYQVFHKKRFTEKSDDEIISDYMKFIDTETNMRLSAYFIHYVLMSLSVPTKLFRSNRTGLELNKIDNKRILERFLCAITTKDLEKLNQNSSSYYSTISNLFEFEAGYSVAQENVLRDLESVKVILSKYKLDKALELLNDDYAKIIAVS